MTDSNPPSMPWVKLYTRYLDNPKISRLPEPAQLRYYQVMMLTGKLDAGGSLSIDGNPLTDDEIAWNLRINTEIWIQDAALLEGNGLLLRNGHGWEIPAFEDEQGPTNAEQREQWKIRNTRRKERKAITGVSQEIPAVNTGVSQEIPALRVRVREESESESEKEKNQNRTDQNQITPEPPVLTDLDSLLKAVSPKQCKPAKQLYKIWGAFTLGNPKLVNLVYILTTRNSLTWTIEYSLAAIAAACSKPEARNPTMLAAHMAEHDKVPLEYYDPKKWDQIPACVLEAAGIEDLKSYIGRKYISGPFSEFVKH